MKLRSSKVRKTLICTWNLHIRCFESIVWIIAIYYFGLNFVLILLLWLYKGTCGLNGCLSWIFIFGLEWELINRIGTWPSMTKVPWIINYLGVTSWVLKRATWLAFDPYEQSATNYKLLEGHLLDPVKARNKVPWTKRASGGHLLNPGHVCESICKLWIKVWLIVWN